MPSFRLQPLSVTVYFEDHGDICDKKRPTQSTSSHPICSALHKAGWIGLPGNWQSLAVVACPCSDLEKGENVMQGHSLACHHRCWQNFELPKHYGEERNLTQKTDHVGKDSFSAYPISLGVCQYHKCILLRLSDCTGTMFCFFLAAWMEHEVDILLSLCRFNQRGRNWSFIVPAILSTEK